ncbi:MAG: outer membrane protein assembly factor BamB [Dechloromonas sp.]|nr:outer membrane protein assembly factor BamB [Dechloromonas sp.]
MISPRHLSVLFLAAGLSSACSTLDAINPFSSSAPKMAPLPVLTANADLGTAWTADAGKSGDYVFVPAVVGESTYVAGAKGKLARYEGGKLVWQIDAGQPLSAGVGADARRVVVGTPKGDVLAFSVDEGRLLWTAKVSSEVLAAPAVGNEGVVVRSGDNQIFFLDAVDGTRKWVYQRATPALSVRASGAPILADRFVFSGFPGGKLLALSVQNGAPVWEGVVALPKGATELDRVADVVAAPAIDGSQICAVAYQGRVVCFDMAQGGALMWSRDISSAAGLALDHRYVFVSDDRGTVYALDRQTGSSLWKQDKLKGRQLSAPAVRQGRVAVADREGYVHFLSREDGQFVARGKTDGSPVRAPITLSGTRFVVQSTGGRVAAFEAQ